MKLQIKTKNKKTLQVEMEENQTIYDLKRELSLYADVGVEPEYQELNFDGTKLRNNKTLKDCIIDIKRIILVTISKKPIIESPSPEPTYIVDIIENNQNENINEASVIVEKVDELDAAKEIVDDEKAALDVSLEKITNMGYSETDALAALKASYNNVERAIEYLVEGIPNVEQQSSINYAEIFGYDSGSDDEVNVAELLRCDPIIRSLQTSIHQNPNVVNDIVKRLCEMNPSLLRLINENQDVFLKMLIDGVVESDSEDEAVV